MNNKAANSVVKFNRMGKAAMTAAPKMRTLGKAVGAALGPLALVGGAIAVVTTGFKTLADQDFAEAKLKSLKVDVDALIPSLKGILASHDNHCFALSVDKHRSCSAPSV